MRALSIKQPWAELILQGRKKIELRSWNTNFRGEFLIHASKVSDEDAMKRFGFHKLHCGGIVGKIDLVNVKNYEETGDFEKDSGLHLVDGSFGGYGFILKNPSRISYIACRGNLNFWEYEK